MGRAFDPPALTSRARSAARTALLRRRLAEPAATGHLRIAQALVAAGVDHVYGVPGQPVYDTYGSCAAAGMRVIGARHQHGGALMALAHNYMAGRQAAVTLLSSGVPSANALAAAVVARDNGWPLTLIAGAAPTGWDGAGYFMEMPVAQVYAPVVKQVITAGNTAGVAASVAEALALAERGRPGPVLVAIAEDLLTAAVVEAVPRPAGDTRRIEMASPDAADLAAVLGALGEAQRPLIVVGDGLRWGCDYAQLAALVERLGALCITGATARGAIPDLHPQCANAVPWQAMGECDLLVLFGARLDWALRYGYPLAAGARIIQIEAEPLASAQGVRPGRLIAASPASVLRALHEAVCQPAGGWGGAADPGWIVALGEQARRARAAQRREASAPGAVMSPLALAAALADALPEGAITVLDGNLSMAACQRLMPVSAPLSRLTPGTSGCMGVGVPYAIGAHLASGRPVVAVCGDFAFGHAAFELETALRHRVPLVVVIVDNGGNGGSLRQRMHLAGHCTEAVTAYSRDTAYDALAAALGAHAQRVERVEEVGPALAQALAAGRPACVHVRVDPDAPFPRG